MDDNITKFREKLKKELREVGNLDNIRDNGVKLKDVPNTSWEDNVFKFIDYFEKDFERGVSDEKELVQKVMYKHYEDLESMWDFISLKEYEEDNKYWAEVTVTIPEDISEPNMQSLITNIAVAIGLRFSS